MSIEKIFGISEKIIEKSKIAEEKVKETFNKIDNISYFNQGNVLEAFQHYKVSNMNFGSSTGYGY